MLSCIRNATSHFCRESIESTIDKKKTLHGDWRVTTWYYAYSPFNIYSVIFLNRLFPGWTRYLVCFYHYSKIIHNKISRENNIYKYAENKINFKLKWKYFQTRAKQLKFKYYILSHIKDF